MSAASYHILYPAINGASKETCALLSALQVRCIALYALEAKVVPVSGLEPPSFSVKGRCPNHLDDTGTKVVVMARIERALFTSGELIYSQLQHNQ